MKVIIAGGRNFRDYNLLIRKCERILKDKTNIEIVSGGQRAVDTSTGELYGADYLGESFASRNGYKVTRFPANWDRYGKSAGPIRNSQMAIYADALIAFWDGKSKGTQNMISLAKDKGLKIRVIKYESNI